MQGLEYPYVLYVPREYRRESRWPLILFLHAADQCGTDGMLPLAMGLPQAVVRDAEDGPFLVLVPQKPDRGSTWADHDAALMAMLERTERQYSVDARRLFLTGLADGGHDTWVLGARHRDLWAAIAPVGGEAPPHKVASALAAMPIRYVHRSDDQAVSTQQDFAAQGSARGRVELTACAEASLPDAYGQYVIADWFLSRGAEQVARAYLAAPATLAAARIELQDVSAGSKTWRLELQGEVVSWSEVADDGTAPRRGTRAGRELLLQALQGLVDGGGLGPRSRFMPPGNWDDMHRLHLQIVLDGDNGPLQFSTGGRCHGFDPQRPQPRVLEVFARRFAGY